jgi:hypothetical protein
MKKKVQVETTFCDHCKKQGYVQSCLGCGVDHCWDCREKLGVVYHEGVHYQSTDGYFCLSCEARPPIKARNIHGAYSAIAQLRREEDMFYRDFKVRKEVAEGRLKALLGKP